MLPAVVFLYVVLSVFIFVFALSFNEWYYCMLCADHFLLALSMVYNCVENISNLYQKQLY